MIGGVSNDVEVYGCHIEDAVTLGGIEPAYSSRNINIHDNLIRNQPYGVLVWPRTPSGTDKLCRNINVHSNTFSELTKGAIWAKVDESGFVADSLSITNNIIYNGDSASFGIRIEGWSKVKVESNQLYNFNVTGSLCMQILNSASNTVVGCIVNGCIFENALQCINISTDGVIVKNCSAINITFDFIVYPASNSFTNCRVSNNDVSVGRDFLRNFSYLSLRHVRSNSLQMPLSSITQLNGASVLARDRFYIQPPVPGSAEGFTCTTRGVVGTSAVLKNFGSIAS